MTIFRILTGIVFIALAGAIYYDIRRGAGGWRSLGEFVTTQTGTALRFWRERKRLGPGSLYDNLRRMSYGLAAAFFVILGITGFLPLLIIGKHLSGVLLIVHVTVAPLFAICLAALALLWAHRLRFDEGEWQFVLDPAARKGAGQERRIRLALKAGFWMVLLFSLPLMGSIILSLFPLFGTEGETVLIRIHGYSALLLLVVSAAEMYLTIAYVKHLPSKGT